MVFKRYNLQPFVAHLWKCSIESHNKLLFFVCSVQSEKVFQNGEKRSLISRRENKKFRVVTSRLQQSSSYIPIVFTINARVSPIVVK